MTKIYIDKAIKLAVFLAFSAITITHSQSSESLNIVYITNTIEKPIYVEKLITKTNIIKEQVFIGKIIQVTNNVEKIVQVKTVVAQQVKNGGNVTTKDQQNLLNQFFLVLFVVVSGWALFKLIEKYLEKIKEPDDNSFS